MPRYPESHRHSPGQKKRAPAPKKPAAQPTRHTAHGLKQPASRPQAKQPPVRKQPAKKQQPVKKTSKVGPNDPCPCGSGKKYKKCCRDKDIAAGMEQ